MIESLLDEPYFTLFPKFHWNPTAPVLPADLLSLYDLSVNGPSKFYGKDFLGASKFRLVAETLDDDDDIIISTNEEIKDLFTQKITEIEEYILEQCGAFYTSYANDELMHPQEFENLSLEKKCEVLGIPQYHTDRNVTALGFYRDLLKAMGRFEIPK